MECDYSSAYVSLYTDSDLTGHGVRPPCFSNEFYTYPTIYQMTFTIGRGNDIVRPVSPPSARHEYRCWKYRFAWQSDKSQTGSSERKRKICFRIWARLGIISSLTLNYDGRCVFNFFLRNEILVNPLPLISQAHHPIMQSSSYLSLVPTVYSLAPYFFLHRIGPEKGVIHIATGAVDNALWDMYAKSRKKPLWELVVDMTPVRLTICMKAISGLTPAPGRTNKRHYIPVRSHLAMELPPFPDKQYLIHVKVYN